MLCNNLAEYVEIVTSKVSLQDYSNVAYIYNQLPRVALKYIAFGNCMDDKE